MVFSLDPIAIVFRICRCHIDALAMILAITPVAIISTSIFEGESSPAVGIPILPVALILRAIRINYYSYAIWIPIFERAFVFRAIREIYIALIIDKILPDCRIWITRKHLNKSDYHRLLISFLNLIFMSRSIKVKVPLICHYFDRTLVDHFHRLKS